VAVIPSTGATVEVAEGGRGVSVAYSDAVEKIVAVTIPKLGVGTDVFSEGVPHPTPSTGIRRRIKINFKKSREVPVECQVCREYAGIGGLTQRICNLLNLEATV
jgi:hypothetical protein